jgi:hypothetical protein
LGNPPVQGVLTLQDFVQKTGVVFCVRDKDIFDFCFALAIFRVYFQDFPEQKSNWESPHGYAKAPNIGALRSG